MVIANFKNDSHPIVYGASQWNYGEVLRIQGLNLPKAVEIHFSLEKTAGQAIPRIGTTKDGVTDVVIPDSLLENEGELQDYFVYVWIYLTDATSGRTEHSLSIKVKARSKPEIPGGDDNADPFREAIEEVNSAAERAESAEKQAGEYAEQTKSDAQQTTQDRQEVEKLVESVSGIGEQVQAVKEYKDQAQTAATNALLSEQKSEQAKEAALQAQARAESAEGKAEQHALEVAGDKAEVERLATQVRQDKSSAEQTVQEFGSTVQQAEQSINTAKTKAVEAVNASKSDAVKAVQTEGEKQTEAVQAKGQEVINSIPEDFPTQMQSKLDKQQGVEHAGKSLIIGEDGTVIVGEPAIQIEVDKTLTQEGQAADAKATGDKILQYAIKNTTSGECILRITDSAEEKLQDIKLFGKSEQLSTTGKNLFDFSNLESGRINTNTGALEEYNHTRRLADYIDITDITSFSVYLPGYNRANGTVYVVIHYYDKDKKYLSYRACGDGLEKYENITPVENAVYIKVTFEQVSIDNPQNIFKVQLEKGTKSTDYEPYTGTKPSPSTAYPQEITSAGKLNADTGKYEVNVQVSSGNIFDVDAVRNENGYLNSDSQTALDTNRFDIVEGRQYLLISKGSTLTDGTGYSTPYFGEDDLRYGLNHLNILGTNPGYQMFTKNERRKVILKAKKSTTITKFIVHGYNRVNDAYEVEEMGLFETSNNNTNIDYVPYKGLQKVQFQLDRPFTKWDRIEKRDGVYGITYSSKHVIFNGDVEETWVKSSIDNAFYLQNFEGLKKSYEIFCDKLITYKGSVNEITQNSILGNTTSLYIRIDGITDVETLRTWLSENNLDVYYFSKESEFVPLDEETQTALNNLHTYYPTTVMSNSEDCEMEVEYVADIKNYIDNKISENVASVISQYQTNVVNLLSLMPLSVQAGMVENDTNNILENVEEMKHE